MDGFFKRIKTGMTNQIRLSMTNRSAHSVARFHWSVEQRGLKMGGHILRIELYRGLGTTIGELPFLV